LEDRSKKYEAIIDDMQAALVRFHKSAVESALHTTHEELANLLQYTMESVDRMVAESKKHEPEPVDNSQLPHSDSGPGSTSPPRIHTNPYGPAGHHIEDADQPHHALQLAAEQASAEAMPGRSWQQGSVYEGMNESDAKVAQMLAPVANGSSYPDPAATGQAGQAPNRFIKSEHSININPDLYLQRPGTLELQPSMTYSDQEMTFSRRLHRAALEKAQYLLSLPEINPSIYKQMFSVSYQYLNVQQLKEQVDLRLRQNSLEPLESFFTFPLTDFGGAGTHYPNFRRRSTSSNSLISLATPLIGPDRPRRIFVTSYEQSIGDDPADDPNGLDGEWFNPDDVAGYFAEERGLCIDPYQAYAEIELVTISPPLSSFPSTTISSFGASMAATPHSYQSIDIRDGTYVSPSSDGDRKPVFNLTTDAGIARVGQPRKWVSSPPVGVLHTPMPDSITGTRLSRKKVHISIDRLVDRKCHSDTASRYNC
jgi:hypothetical protein